MRALEVTYRGISGDAFCVAFATASNALAAAVAAQRALQSTIKDPRINNHPLDETTFDAAWAEERALTLAQAIAPAQSPD